VLEGKLGWGYHPLPLKMAMYTSSVRLTQSVLVVISGPFQRISKVEVAVCVSVSSFVMVCEVHVLLANSCPCRSMIQGFRAHRKYWKNLAIGSEGCHRWRNNACHLCCCPGATANEAVVVVVHLSVCEGHFSKICVVLESCGVLVHRAAMFRSNVARPTLHNVLPVALLSGDR
jgi:hypothetical protein